MLVRQAINTHIKPLQAADTVNQALMVMINSGHTHFPVVEKATNRFLGIVARETLEKHPIKEAGIFAIREKNPQFAHFGQHIFDVARVMERHGYSLLPVLDQEHRYAGATEKKVLFENIIQMMNITEYGSLLTIHFEGRDFTLSQLVRIIEEEGALILGLSVEPPTKSHPFYVVSVKLNIRNPDRIVASLKRHAFIVNTHGDEELEERRYKERADELMHYLNM